MQDALPFVNDIAEQLPTLLSAEDVSVPLEMAVFTSLWGNKMDLSLWPSKSVSAKDDNVCIYVRCVCMYVQPKRYEVFFVY